MNKILFVLHLPPPVHGASMVGQQIKESRIINDQFDCRYLNLGLSATLNEIGKNATGKIFRYFLLLGKVITQLLLFKPALIYISLRANGIGLYKDVPVVMLAKLSGARLVYHFHNKGVVTRQEQRLDNWFYRYLFKNTEVILLSKILYPDVNE